MKYRQSLLLLALFLPGIGLCAEAPVESPRHALYVGTIDGIDSAGMMVVVNDRVYYLTESTRIESPGGIPVPHSALEKGQQVNLDVIVGPEQRLLLTRVRIRNGAAATGN